MLIAKYCMFALVSMLVFFVMTTIVGSFAGDIVDGYLPPVPEKIYASHEEAIATANRGDIIVDKYEHGVRILGAFVLIGFFAKQYKKERQNLAALETVEPPFRR